MCENIRRLSISRMVESFCADDPWLDGHVTSLWWDMMFTLWESLYYAAPSNWSSEEALEIAIAGAIATVSK